MGLRFGSGPKRAGVAGQKDFTPYRGELRWEQLHGGGLGALPAPHPSPPGAEGVAETGVSTGKEEARPQRAHLLEEPNVQNWEAGVQQVEKHQEPAFIQRLGGEGGEMWPVVSLQMPNGHKQMCSPPEETHPRQLSACGGFRVSEKTRWNQGLG